MKCDIANSNEAKNRFEVKQAISKLFRSGVQKDNFETRILFGLSKMSTRSLGLQAFSHLLTCNHTEEETGQIESIWLPRLC